MFPGEGFSLVVETMAAAAQSVGRKISRREWATDVTLKASATLGTSSVAAADILAEQEIVRIMDRAFPKAYYVGEESDESKNVKMMLTSPLTFFIDPRDGTTEDSHELPFFSVSIGAMEKGVLTVGAVFAPEVRGGLLIVAEKDKGVHLAEHNRPLQPIEEAVNVAKGASPVGDDRGKKGLVDLSVPDQRRKDISYLPLRP